MRFYEASTENITNMLLTNKITDTCLSCAADCNKSIYVNNNNDN